MAKLVAEEGVLKELVLSLDKGDQWVIGRDPDASQLLVEDPAASRRHAICRKTPEGFVIENFSTTTPLLVNNKPIEEPKLLHDRDTVKIGESIFRFYEEAEADSSHGVETNIPEKQQAAFPSPKIDLADNNRPHDTIFTEGHEKIEGAQINFDLLETGRWLLKVISGPNNGAEFSMQVGSAYILGTDPNTCDIVFHDNSVSRQHAKLTIDQDEALTIEDLKSRNGTRVDGELISMSQPLLLNTLVTVGTTSFVVYDREGEMQTIISPLLPSIVKTLKEGAETVQKSPGGTEEAKESALQSAQVKSASENSKRAAHGLGALILIAILIGLFAVMGIAVQTLLLQEPVTITPVIETGKLIEEMTQEYPGVRATFNKANGQLLVSGHVLTPAEKRQLIYSLNTLDFVRDVDDKGVIVDEYLWSEANQVLSRNPNWQGVTVQVSAPGKFVVSGYLQSRATAGSVMDYLSRNFPYLDSIDNKIIIEEDIVSRANDMLLRQGINNVTVQMSKGELTLSGSIPESKVENLQALVTQFQEVLGVRVVRNLVTLTTKAEGIINISDRYQVTGVSRADKGRLSVIVNGRILTEGDILDGMTVTHIQPNVVNLEREGIKYRIDYFTN